MEWTEKALAWKQTMEEFAAVGETRARFCEQRGIRLSTFDYWRMRIRRTEQPQGDVVRVGRVGLHEPAVRVRIDERVVVELDGMASAEQLQRVLRAAESL